MLTAVGLYAVLAYVVRLRGREMAIRDALGASPALLRALILRQGLLMAGAGVALGVPMAIAGGRLLGSLLFEVSPGDPPTLCLVAAALVAMALLASYLPALRAMRPDVMALLRSE